MSKIHGTLLAPKPRDVFEKSEIFKPPMLNYDGLGDFGIYVYGDIQSFKHNIHTSLRNSFN